MADGGSGTRRKPLWPAAGSQRRIARAEDRTAPRLARFVRENCRSRSARNRAASGTVPPRAGPFRRRIQCRAQCRCAVAGPPNHRPFHRLRLLEHGRRRRHRPFGSMRRDPAPAKGASPRPSPTRSHTGWPRSKSIGFARLLACETAKSSERRAEQISKSELRISDFVRRISDSPPPIFRSRPSSNARRRASRPTTRGRGSRGPNSADRRTFHCCGRWSCRTLWSCRRIRWSTPRPIYFRLESPVASGWAVASGLPIELL